MSAAERVASMSPDELIAVIERGLNADEQAARVCSGDGQWTAEDIASIGPNLGVEPRQHMARHDPARVLSDVESKRAILAEHHPVDPCDAHDASLRTMACTTLIALACPYLDRERS